MKTDTTTTTCAHCGAEIFRIQNTNGPEVWAEEPDGGVWGCLQAAWDKLGHDPDDEPPAPYPPHVPA
jgi:hypothetical protein